MSTYTYQAVMTTTGTVKAGFTDRYGADIAPKIATSIVARSGVGVVTLKDTLGKTLDTIALDSTGATAPIEFSNFAFVAIVSLGAITSVEIYA